MAPAERAIGAGQSTLIRIIWMLDLDHIGAEQGQLIGRERACQHVRRIDHPNAFKRTLHQ